MRPGDLVEVVWHDSSGGRIQSLQSLKKIDIKATSWGIYVGDFGEDEAHVVLLTEIYRKEQHAIGFEVNAIVKKTVKIATVIKAQYFDLSSIQRKLESKINEQLIMGKVQFRLEVKQW